MIIAEEDSAKQIIQSEQIYRDLEKQSQLRPGLIRSCQNSKVKGREIGYRFSGSFSCTQPQAGGFKTWPQ